MNAPLFLIAVILLLYAAWFLHHYGLRALLYMASARLEAAGDAVGLYRTRKAEYQQQALERAGYEDAAEVGVEVKA